MRVDEVLVCFVLILRVGSFGKAVVVVLVLRGGSGGKPREVSALLGLGSFKLVTELTPVTEVVTVTAGTLTDVNGVEMLELPSPFEVRKLVANVLGSTESLGGTSVTGPPVDKAGTPVV